MIYRYGYIVGLLYVILFPFSGICHDDKWIYIYIYKWYVMGCSGDIPSGKLTVGP